MLPKMSLWTVIFVNMFTFSGHMVNIIVQAPKYYWPVGEWESERIYSKTYVQTVFFNVNVICSKFAVPAMISGCNLLRLQMMPREVDKVRLKSCHLHGHRLGVRRSTSYMHYIHGKLQTPSLDSLLKEER